MTAVFASQGWGQLSAALVSLAVLAAFKKQILADPANYPRHLDFCWRLLIGLGAVPGGIALYFRLTLPETPRFTMDIERNVKQASTDVDAFLTSGHFVADLDSPQLAKVDAPVASRRDFFRHFGKWENGKVLLGCAWSWFALGEFGDGVPLSRTLIPRPYRCRFLRSWTQLVYHSLRYWIRLRLQGHSSVHSLPDPSQPVRRQHHPLGGWSDPRLLGHLPLHRSLGPQAYPAHGLHQ